MMVGDAFRKAILARDLKEIGAIVNSLISDGVTPEEIHGIAVGLTGMDPSEWHPLLEEVLRSYDKGLH